MFAILTTCAQTARTRSRVGRPAETEKPARGGPYEKIMNGPNIQIFVSCHKECVVPDVPLLRPIQVGAALAERRLAGMLHDDEGENISAKNKSYCELTAQYWAWKNADADYYGFFHYRRYLSFAREPLPADAFGEAHLPCNDEAALQKCGIDGETMAKTIAQYDLIVPQEGGFPERSLNLYRQYCIAPVHHKSDLDFVLGVIREDYPAMYPYAMRYIKRKKGYFCNMFIMKKELFDEYNRWLFSILEKHEKAVDISAYSDQAMRVHGFLAERLCGIFLDYVERTRSLRILKLQRVFFDNVDPEPVLRPAFAKDNAAIVFSANDFYVPYLAALLRSIEQHASPRHNYDLIVLHRDIRPRHRALLQAMLPRDNFSLRFFDVTRPMSRYAHLPLRGHFRVETYFRLLLPELLPDYDKIVYLDSDMIVCADVAELYETDVEGYLLAACRDADTAGLYNGYEPQKKKYTDEVMKLKAPYDYFQAGMLVLNLAQFRKTYTAEEMMRLAASYQWELLDQDVLNMLAEGKVRFVDTAWNVLVDWRGIRIRDIIGRAPQELYQDYMRARRAPKIIHYAGPDKPWTDPESDFAEEFWQASRATPWHEAVLARMSRALAGNAPRRRSLYRAVEDSLLRPIAGVFFPVGTKRREALKKLLRRGR